MTLSLRQAAEQCGKSRSTIHRALKSGKLSGSRGEDGSWAIDPSELARVFPWDVSEHAQRDGEGQVETPPSSEADILTVKVEMLEQQLEREQATVEDLRRRLDRAEERVYALSAPAHTGEPQRASRGGLWGWLLGR